MNDNVTYYKNANGEVLKIYKNDYPEDIDNPLFDDEWMNDFTWEAPYSSIQSHFYREIDDWFNKLVGQGAFKRLKSKSKNFKHFLDLLTSSLDEVGIVAFPILKYAENEEADIIYYVDDDSIQLDGSLVGFAWNKKDVLCQRHHCKEFTSELFEHTKRNVKISLGSYSLYANGYVFSFELYDRNGIQWDAAYGAIYKTIEEMFEFAISEIKEFVDDVEFVKLSDEEKEAVA